MGREDFSQSSQLSTLVGKPTNRYQRLPKNVNTLRRLTEAKAKPNNRYHYSIYPLVQKEYQASYTQLTNLDFYSPIITIKGSAIVSHLIGTTYEDAGVTVDEGSTLISTVSTVDDTKFGIYSVTYTSTDGINPDTSVVRTVKVGLPPDVTINGQNPFNLEKFDVYVDPGITINDSNSFLTSTTSTLNNLAVGTYTVNYTVSNPAFTKVFSRTVRVDDTIPPVITIAGDNPYTLERFGVYTDPGATVDLGSELTNTNLSNVQNTAIGSFDVVYTAYDGNTTVTATRTVNVVDTVPPVITILGDNPYTLERFDVYTDQGATVDVGSVLTTDVSAVNNTLTHGSSFVVTYTATDGNTAHDVTQTRTVNIVDTKPPVITLLGDVDPYQIQPAIPFQDVDPGFEVDLGTSVSVDYSNVVTTDNSNFDVVYRASDGVNPDTVVIRRVAVADTLSPVVILNGPSVVTLERYAEYVEQSVTLDPGSSLVSTITDLDNTTVGSYTVTYLATDNINPDTTNVRIINVVDTTAPIVTLNGASSVTLERYGVFADTDPGVTIDANGTLVSVDISQLDNTTQGAYTVTYNVVDDHNNANVITREVVVEDTVPPVVTLNNESTSYTLERYGDWSAIDPGVTTDIGSYVDSVTVDNTSTGLKVVTYTVKDGTNTTVKNRVITVVDTVAPVGSINNPSYQLERFGVFNDPGVTDLDPGTYLAGTDTSNVDNTLSPGSTFDVIYDLSDDTSNIILTRTVTVVDTNPPDIIVTGGDVTVERFSTYVDLGATVDAGSTLLTTILSNVDTSLSPGSTFDIVYNAVDASGNESSNIRTVTIQDTVDPVIIINGGSSTTLERFGEYIDLGATVDAGSTLLTTNFSNVDNTLSAGSTFDIVYNAVDTSGNESSNIRTVTIEDTVDPVIIINGGSSTTLERFGEYIDLGATVDAGSTLLTTNFSNVDNTLSVGSTFDIVYNAVDTSGNESSNIRTVTIEDTVDPVIIINGGSSTTLERFGEYIDLGATVDAGSTLLTTNFSNVDNTLSVGSTFDIVYNAVDTSGNESSNIRTVTIEDTIAPVASLNGPNSITIERYAVWEDVDPGINLDAGSYITSITGLNNTVVGTYLVAYNLSDGVNSNTITRAVTVEDTIAPVGTINNPSYTLERFSTYVDQGVTDLDAGTYLASTDTSNVDNTLAPGSTFDVVYDLGDGTNNTHIIRTVTVVDTTQPVGTINNPSYTLERFSTYVDQGVTDLDAGTYLASTDTSNVDNTLAPGSTFDVVYDLGDGTNNTHIIRTVTVVDTTQPVGTINNPSYTLERFSTYVDQGVTDLDAGTYLAGTDLSNVDATLSHGSTFDVVYDLGDGTNNTHIIRTVTVVDTTPPSGTINNPSLTVERFGVYNDPVPGVINLDQGSYIAGVDLSNVDTNLPPGSTFDVVYDLGDGTNNTHIIRTVTIVDTVAPVVQLIGANPLFVERNTYWPSQDPGLEMDQGTYIASRTYNNNTLNVNNVPTIDTVYTHSYTMTYYFSDGANSGTITRDVIVRDTTAPLITLYGDNPYTLRRLDTYNDPGAYGDLGTTIISTVSNVNNAAIGTYTVEYTATDDSPYTTTATRTVNVIHYYTDSTDYNNIPHPEFSAEAFEQNVFVGVDEIANQPIPVTVYDYNQSSGLAVYQTFTAPNYGTNNVTPSLEVSMSKNGLYLLVLTVNNNFSIFAKINSVWTHQHTEYFSGYNVLATFSYDGSYLVYKVLGTIKVLSRNNTVWSSTGLSLPTLTGAGQNTIYASYLNISGDGSTIVASITYFQSTEDVIVIYKRSGSTWSSHQIIHTEYNLPGNIDFIEISYGGDKILYSTNSNLNTLPAGYVVLYTLTSGTWIRSVINAPNTNTQIGFGRRIRLSLDNSRLAITVDSQYKADTRFIVTYILNGTTYELFQIITLAPNYSPTPNFNQSYDIMSAVRTYYNGASVFLLQRYNFI
jgi:glutamine amidotransferase PdxT